MSTDVTTPPAAASAGFAIPDRSSLVSFRYLSQTDVPWTYATQGYNVGGLSGIDYDPTTQTFVSESDHGFGGQATHYFTLAATATPGTPGYALTFTGAVPLGPDDVESIRFDPAGNGVFYTTEGLPPRIFHRGADGTTVQLPVPANIATRAQANQSFEGSTFTPDGAYVVSMENALRGDAPDLTRITRFNADGSVAAQYAYPLDTLPGIVDPPGAGKGNNGVSDILALSDTSFLVLERAWDGTNAAADPTRSHNSIRIYRVDTAGAPDVQGVTDLEDGTTPALAKTLVFDSASLAGQLDTYGTKVDNIEGMTFGPKLPDGHESFVLVNDDNYSATQNKTQFLVFEAETAVPAQQYWDGAGPMADGTAEGGAGTWSADPAAENWARAGGAVNDGWNGGTAVFGATGGTVTVSDAAGAVSAAALDFAVTGYTIAGDALTLSAADTAVTVENPADTATIAAPLTGPGRLDKTGAGTLALDGANGYAGGTLIGAGTLELGGMGAAGTGAIAFGPGGATLRLDATGTLAAPVTGFAAGDALDLAGLAAAGATAAFDGTILTVSGQAANGTGPASVALAVSAPPAGSAFQLSADAAGDVRVTLAALPPAPAPAIQGGASGTATATPAATTPPATAPQGGAPAGTAAPAAPPLVAPPTNNSPGAGVAVAVDPAVAFDGHGGFTLTGHASGPAPIAAVTLSALVDGTPEELGTADLAPDGSFTFTDPVGAGEQDFIAATATDASGRRAFALAPFALRVGRDGRHGAQDRYTADLSVFEGTTRFGPDGAVTGETAVAPDGTALSTTTLRPDGARRVAVAAGGQTFASGFFDTVDNGGAPDTRFVFDPGHGLAVLRGFRPDGTDHDTIDLPGADFGDSLAAVLRDSRAGAGGLVITDPVSGDTIRIAGLAKATLAHNPQDIAFHP